MADAFCGLCAPCGHSASRHHAPMPWIEPQRTPRTQRNGCDRFPTSRPRLPTASSAPPKSKCKGSRSDAIASIQSRTVYGINVMLRTGAVAPTLQRNGTASVLSLAASRMNRSTWDTRLVAGVDDASNANFKAPTVVSRARAHGGGTNPAGKRV